MNQSIRVETPKTRYKGQDDVGVPVEISTDGLPGLFVNSGQFH